MSRNVVLVLHDIRSAYNVGSMFRTADGMGVSRIYLSGYTQAPAEAGKRFLTDAQKALHKTALGAEYSVPWERTEDVSRLLDRLHGEGCHIVSLESGVGGSNIRSFGSGVGDVALFVGNEISGVEVDILARSDSVLEIPMRGVKRSLNVAVAVGIALFQLDDTMEAVTD